MRIYKHKLYIAERTPGISGFQKWGQKEFRVIGGVRARLLPDNLVVEYKIGQYSKFRFEDGHLPEFQLIVNELKMVKMLSENPWLTFFVLE